MALLCAQVAPLVPQPVAHTAADKHANVVVKDASETRGDSTRYLGMIIVPGAHVARIEAHP